ncbi:MAG: twin arginine-targeting protein translocase TatC [Chloroflexi bacterium RIFCSPLOWO2_02_FULL_71_16]|nr:MAG: twin arginine-targeting protein translocase TatC [Chloroflexi bacterium GWC2_70_10]OGO68315.1 MAG: twin arginine-targeting protein translocase TatC [Chloroflexi bacterium RIFCSPLOWO2_02_FULL_71_16]
MTVTARDKELSLIQHLDELRRRMYVMAIGVGVMTAISFTFAETLIRILLLPSGQISCITLAPTEGFATFMRVALFAGIAMAMPIIVWQIFAYVDPALMPNERRFVLRLGPFVVLLFITGMAFCYFLLLPQALGFLVNFGGDVFDTQLRCAEYLSFVTTFILGMGIVFEVPAIMFALVRVRILRRAQIAGFRRYVFLGVFVVAALITPTPDPFNQTLVAVPLYVLFELGLFLSRFAEGRPAAAAS